MKKRALIGGVAAAASLIAFANTALADNIVRVDQNNEAGWTFNGDAATATPYEFSLEEHSLGSGSLRVLPIKNTADDGTTAQNSDKFIAGLALGVDADSIESFAYDLLIDGPATAEEHFYLNVYAIRTGSSEPFYDCRYDYVPAAGSNSAFTTASFAASDTPVNVRDRNTADGIPCAETLADFDGTVRAIALNVGDTSGSDTDIGGYLDNVRVDTVAGTTTYDFEVLPLVKDACKDGGWDRFGLFASQGDCVSYLQASVNANN